MIKSHADVIPSRYLTGSSPDGESARRLIVLVPPAGNYTAITRRIWELANTLGCQILFLSLCTDPAEESSLRRQLITMCAMVQDGRVCADVRVEVGSNWVRAIKADLLDGDVVVCFTEHRTGLLLKPLSQILHSNLNVPIYILSGFSPTNWPQSNPLSQIFGWIGSIVIIIVALLFQLRIMTLSENWAQTALMIFSVLGEIWLIWSWNNLFT